MVTQLGLGLKPVGFVSAVEAAFLLPDEISRYCNDLSVRLRAWTVGLGLSCGVLAFLHFDFFRVGCGYVCSAA